MLGFLRFGWVLAGVGRCGRRWDVFLAMALEPFLKTPFICGSQWVQDNHAMTSVQPFPLTGKRRRSRPGGLWVLAL
ncbi:hypothetical protein, partial [Ideonella sp.]|uniref:hypothetical protein n=1 Tax=Ideonella sp. TaxID=1929293 RepID=UPI003BB74612